MSVRCKMIVTEKQNRVAGYQPKAPPTCTVKLTPVCDPANTTWAKYTPNGSVELQIDNASAYDAFVLGKTYFVDFTEAPAPEHDERAP